MEPPSLPLTRSRWPKPLAWRQPWRRCAGDDRERESAREASRESGSAKGSRREEEDLVALAAVAAVPAASAALVPETGKEEKGAADEEEEEAAAPLAARPEGGDRALFALGAFLEDGGGGAEGVRGTMKWYRAVQTGCACQPAKRRE